MLAIMSAILTYFSLIVTPKARCHGSIVLGLPSTTIAWAPKGALIGQRRTYREFDPDAKAQGPAQKPGATAHFFVG
jgi:hypothetical protein